MSTKDQLLMSLKAEKGSWVSGEFLGRSLTISRSAIWKHVRTLKDEGYIIESSRKKGYLFRQMTDSLLPNEIREGLKTNVFGKCDIAYFGETDSTNIRAEHLAAEGAPEGAVVIAEKQTQGKGRRGRYWFSPSGEGIYASVVLRPRISPHEAPKLTLMASVAVAETILSVTSLRVNIKWPNDIIVNGKKLAGILTEISAEMDRIHYVVIGLGVNVNIRFESFPSDIRNLATSILLETGEVSQRITLLRTYLEWLELYYEMFRVRGFQPIMDRWKQLSDMPGKQIRVDLIDRTHEGVVQDIDEDGFLILKDHEGNLRKIISGDITLC
jgi:BirA family biotin operon repressor/biotin-[acetyl-CoA-carboxylase] ligase